MQNLAKDIKEILKYTNSNKFDKLEFVDSITIVNHWEFIIDQIQKVIARAKSDEIAEINNLCIKKNPRKVLIN